MNYLEPIAIIGISCEFAGDIHSPAEFWQALKENRDLSSEIPEERMDLRGGCVAHMLNKDANGEFEKSLMRRGCFLSNSQFDSFDPAFFGLGDGETAAMDPCHRLLMLKFVHLLDDAGYTMDRMRGSRTSVHIAQFSQDHVISTMRLNPEQLSRFHGSNTILYNASARLSYHFDLRSSNLTMDVACSGSLQAVHLAVQTLRTREADMAVCGGVNSIYAPENIVQGSLIGAISPDGKSRAFSVDASGYAKGEGLGLILLKRLSDAERDGDRIYCVLHDILSNHDGCEGKNSYVVPSEPGQRRLLTETYGRTGYDPKRIFYVEAHGTGTAVGDPIEANTLGRFFNRSPFDPPLLIGSVKSNIGHTEGTAGIASIIKAALCMRYRAIPPSINFVALNPKIEAQRYNLHVVQSVVPLPPLDVKEQRSPVAIGVNSFGIGGNNVHAIIEEYNRPRHLTNGYAKEEEQNPLQTRQHFLFIFSSRTPESLHKQVVQFNAWLQNALATVNDDEESLLMGVSKQLLLKRTISHEHLAVFVSADRKQLQEQIDSFLAEQPSSPGLLITKRSPLLQGDRRACFVFSGQGPQWWAMGRQLYAAEPIFRGWIEKIDKALTKVNGGEWCLLDELIGKNSEDDSRINDTNLAQPALFAVQVALAALLVSWHILPSAIVSHSAGEQAAAFVAGRLSLEEAVRIVYHRSRLQHRNTRQGGRMLAVGMSEKEARETLLVGIEHLVCVAVVNSPRSITLSGDAKIIDELKDLLTTFHPNVFKAQLRIENAFHSHQMDRFDIRQEILSTLADIRGLPLKDHRQMFAESCAQVPLYSSVTGGRLDETTPVDAHYWWSNIRQCVRFSDAMHSILQDETIDTFLEFSPHPVLATSIRECCENMNYQALILPTLKRKEDEQSTLLTSLAQLTYSPTVWSSYLASRSIQLHDADNEEYLFDSFPVYPFHTTVSWYESKASVLKRRAHRLAEHPLLGVRQLTLEHTCATWKRSINIQRPEHQYLRDHKMQGAILFPAGAFLELAEAACLELLPKSNSGEPLTLVFEQVEFLKALHLTENELTEVFTQVIGVPMREWYIYSRPFPSAGADCIRTGGMAGTDVVSSFVDHQVLHENSMREFTLHARGRVDVGPQLNMNAAFAVRLDPNDVRFVDQDVSQVYAYLATRGYEYGPKFRATQALKTSKSEFIASCNYENVEDIAKYQMHPQIGDGCCNCAVALMPDHDLYLPSGIGKVVAFGGIANISSLITCGSFHPTMAGVASERSFTVDITFYDGNEDIRTSKPLFMMQNFKYERVPGPTAVEKTVFEQVNEMMNLPNANPNIYIDTILTDYCFQKKWSEKMMSTESSTSIVDLFAACNTLLVNHHVEDENEIDKQLANSVNDLNALASSYALLAIKQLASRGDGDGDNSISKKKLEQYVRTDAVHFQRLFVACFELAENHFNETITAHSIKLERKRLLAQYPALRPLLIVFSECGLRLGRILAGEEHPEEFLFSDHPTTEEMSAAKALQQVQSVLMAATSKTRVMFQSLLNHMKKDEQQVDKQQRMVERRMRMMFVGGGTSDAILPVLRQIEDFVENENNAIQVEVVYADIAQTLLDEAKQTLEQSLLTKTTKQRFSITYHIFDIESDNNATEAIATEAFDLIFAANVLHTTSDRVQSLSALRRLLVPGGLLMLVELTRWHAYFDLFYGLFPYWWRDNNQRAVLSIDQWTTNVQSAGGFELPLTVIPPTKSDNTFGDSLILIRKTRSPPILMSLPEWQQQGWLILADRNRTIARSLVPYLPCSNVQVIINDNTFAVQNICHEITQMLTQYKDQYHIVFAWPLDLVFHNDDQETIAVKQQQAEQLCSALVQILQAIRLAQPSKYPFIYILTENTQDVAATTTNPLTASLIGLARSLTIEYPGNGQGHRVKFIDLQPADEHLVPVLAQHLVDCRWADHLDEIIFRQDSTNNTGNIMRLEWNYGTVKAKQKESKTIVEHQSSTKVIVPFDDADQFPFRLEVAPSRFLADLAWVHESPLSVPPAASQIHVRVHSVGLNFRDVLKACGLYPHTRLFAQSDEFQSPNDRDECFGIDFSGTVVRCSPSSQLKPGDRVFGCCLRGVFHSHLCVDEQEVIRVPSDCKVTYEQLASLPTAFNTALYSLKYRVQLVPEQTVLVHAATGSTGQAFIQYCQSVGARVLATAGSEEKRRFLREHYGLEHVFNSRDLSFVTEVRKILPDGVDVVVNSLAGPLLQASVGILSPHGHFVELGKRDIFDKNNLSLFHLRRDCSFHVIDLSLVSLGHRKNLSNKIMNDLSDYVCSEQFKPIEPLTVVEPSNVIEAFTKCNLGKMMGKIIVRLTSSKEPLHVNMKPQLLQPKENEEQCMFPSLVCDQGTIVISGGFGGLGLTMSRWMVEERGVKRIVLMSRRTLSELERPDNPQYTEWLRLKQVCGASKNTAQVEVVQADVTNYDDVRNLIERFSQTAYPVRGIIHSAVVSQDKLLSNLTPETLKLATDAKVRGAWNLHYAALQARAPLHFFIMFSSIRNHLIDFGSGGYNAGNEFLDALAHYRSNILHQPALSVSLPAVGGAGMFHREREMLTQLYSSHGLETVPTVITFELIDRLFTTQEQCPCPIILACNWKAMGASSNQNQFVTYQMAQLVERQQVAQDNADNTTGTAQMGTKTMEVDEVIDRTQATVARLLGASNIERITTDRSLLAQGMDSLAGVALYNWLGQYFGVFIPLTDILQGISIQTIAKNIFDKLEEQRQVAPTLTSETSISTSSDNDNKVISTNDAYAYTGMNNIIRVIQPRVNSATNQRTVFCIGMISPSVEKTLLTQQSLLLAYIYVLHIPTESSAVAETIAQMRRIQPRGPYSLVTVSKQGEHIARQIIKELEEQHQQAGVEHFLAMIDPTPPEPLEQ